MKRRIITLIASIGLTLGSVFLIAAPASASTSGINVSTSSCNEQIFASWSGTNASQYWTHNGCGWYQRPKIFCTGHNTGQYLYGGWVKSVNYTSGVTCPTGLGINHYWIQWEHVSGGTVYSYQAQ